MSNGMGSLEEGEIYTVSLCVTPAQGVEYFSLFLSEGYANNVKLYPNGTSKQIIRSTFKARYYDGRLPLDNFNYGRIDIFRFPQNGITENSTIHWIKIEKGTIATDYAPAPEDIEARIKALETKIAELTQSGS